MRAGRRAVPSWPEPRQRLHTPAVVTPTPPHAGQGRPSAISSVTLVPLNASSSEISTSAVAAGRPGSAWRWRLLEKKRSKKLEKPLPPPPAAAPLKRSPRPS